MSEQQKVVTLCGSSRFTDIMAVCAWIIERDENKIAMGLHLLPDWYPDGPPDHLAEHEGVADQMDALHLEKIDLSDEVFVVNFDDYIGESTTREIAHAVATGKPVRYFMSDAVGVQVLGMMREAQDTAKFAALSKEQETVNFASLCADQAKWSNATFGNESVKGPIGPIKHLKKECNEVLAAPDDLGEYADIFLLALDAQRRAGMSPQQIISNASAKLQIVKTRTYIVDPDNRDQAVEHERGKPS